MISRLTAAATIFAVLATSTIAWAATTRLDRTTSSNAACAAAPLEVVTLPTVEVTAKRAAAKVAQR